MRKAAANLWQLFLLIFWLLFFFFPFLLPPNKQITQELPHCCYKIENKKILFYIAKNVLESSNNKV